MKIKVITAWLMLAFASAVSAQNASVRGKVIDLMNNEPLPFVSVVVSGTNIGAVTDFDGRFLITGLNPGFVRL